MRLLNIEWRNFASYGNKIQSLSLDENTNLYLVMGENGSGKCFFPTTKLKIRAIDEKTLEKIKKFKK